MKWDALSKEQKQAIVLIGMWLVGSLFALYQFILSPLLKTSGESESELDELHANIAKAEAAVQGESKLRVEYTLSTKDLQKANDQYIVPIENPLSWVTEKVYASGRQVGVDIQSVGEVSLQAFDVSGDRIFRPYTVRIVMESTYNQLLALIGELESSNPYLCVGTINVSVGQSVTRHLVDLIVEWPMWSKKVEIGAAKHGKPAAAAAKPAAEE